MEYKLMCIFVRNGEASEPFPIEVQPQLTVKELKQQLSRAIQKDMNSKLLIVRCQVVMDNEQWSKYFSSQVKTQNGYFCLDNVTIDPSQPIFPQLPKTFIDYIRQQTRLQGASTTPSRPTAQPKGNAKRAPPPTVDPNRWECEVCTAENDKTRLNCEVCESPRTDAAAQVQQDYPMPARKPARAPSPVPVVGWECDTCTLLNIPTRPSCEACGSDRPAGYIMPKPELLTAEARNFLARLEAAERHFNEYSAEEKQREAEEAKKNFESLRVMDQQGVYKNTEPFECSICMDEIAVNEGVTLRSCTHEYCVDCLKTHIQKNQNIPIPCPNNDLTGNTCNGVLEHREIKAVLGEELFNEYLKKENSMTEARLQNTFHCRTADCVGWVFFADNVNDYKCDVCGIQNCITCKAQHAPHTCKEYQDDLRRRALRDENARKDLELIEQLIRDKLAMKCPHCEVVLQKKSGCDWMMCSMCKTEICWATRGPRWGPKGRGDTSGGCQCKVNGKRCDPACQNCH